MLVESFDFTDRNYEHELLGRLRENVFHLTTEESFQKIKKDGFVFNNKNGKYPVYAGSDKSFGRNQGWVCLFDLRSKSEQEIEDTLSRYYFLGPSWFVEYLPDRTDLRLAYLLLEPKCYNRLIPNETARALGNDPSVYTQHVPKAECWFPGNMPLAFVQQVLLIRIRKSTPKDNPLLYAHHLLELGEQQRRKRS